MPFYLINSSSFALIYLYLWCCTQKRHWCALCDSSLSLRMTRSSLGSFGGSKPKNTQSTRPRTTSPSGSACHLSSRREARTKEFRRQQATALHSYSEHYFKIRGLFYNERAATAESLPYFRAVRGKPPRSVGTLHRGNYRARHGENHPVPWVHSKERNSRPTRAENHPALRAPLRNRRQTSDNRFQILFPE